LTPSYSAIGATRYGGEWSTLMVPRHPDHTRRAVIYAHGANGDGTQVLDTKTLMGLVSGFGAIALAGYVVLCGDFGGPQTYGNDAELAAMETAWAWLQGSGLCATDKVILTGASMGSLSTHRFAAAHPGSVAGLNLWMPALDVEDLRNRNPLALRDLIDAAWGLPAGSTVAGGGAPVPTRGRPLDRLSAFDVIPTHLWYSTADTVTLPGPVDTYTAGRQNVTKHVTSGVADHGNGVIAPTDWATVLAFLGSIAQGT
jgi:hypothetical protein